MTTKTPSILPVPLPEGVELFVEAFGQLLRAKLVQVDGLVQVHTLAGPVSHRVPVTVQARSLDFAEKAESVACGLAMYGYLKVQVQVADTLAAE